MCFELMRLARQRAVVRFELLAGALMSDRAVEDVCQANPFLDTADVLQLLSACSAIMFRVVRLGQLNAVIEALVDVRDKLRGVCAKTSSWAERLAFISAIRHRAAGAAANLMAKRHYAGKFRDSSAHAERKENVSYAEHGDMQLQLRGFTSRGTDSFTFDPRYLVFEFGVGFMLRQRQVNPSPRPTATPIKTQPIILTKKSGT